MSGRNRVPADISTHTLARRVTAPCTLPEPCRCYFNPHPRTEGDISATETRRQQDISTHTLARRVTGIQHRNAPLDVISTHTLARRVTVWQNTSASLSIFQPTPSHGG